jgi:hypothetical protein
LLVVVLGCEPLGSLLDIEVLGLLSFVARFDILSLLLLDETSISNLLIDFVGVGVLGFKVGT